MLPLIQPLFLEAAVLVLGIAILMLEAFAKDTDRRTFAWAGVAGLSMVFVLSFFSEPTPTGNLSGIWSFYSADPMGTAFKQFMLLTTIIVLIMSVDYSGLLARNINRDGSSAGVGEFFALPILTCAGLMWMVSAVDFVMIFVALEMVTISFYILVGYMRRNLASLEAGTKYLILGALSTGFLVYGIAWIFGMTGQTNLDAIRIILATGQVNPTGVMFGALLVIIALGFKIAAVPFHFWVPDVYQGAPAPITAFLSVGSKAAGFIVLLRVLDAFSTVPLIHARLLLVLSVLAVLTLFFGNLAALPQENVKRMLAYSSIAHAGYLLVGVAAVSYDAVAFYLVGYMMMTLLAFLVLVLVLRSTGADDLSSFRGLAVRSRFLAFAMLVAMISLAGLPFTIGFFGKFMIFAAAMEQEMYWIAAVGALGVACGFYYYFKVIRAMYWHESENMEAITIHPVTRITMGVLIVLIFALGIYPEPVLTLLR